MMRTKLTALFVVTMVGWSSAVADEATPEEMPKNQQAVAAIQQADALVQKAEETYKQAILAAKRKCAQDLDAAIKAVMKAGDLDDAKRIDGAKKRIEAEIDDLLAGAKSAGDDQAYHACVLGRYVQWGSNKTHPYVNLSTPAENLWTDRIKAGLAGKIDFSEIAYEGTAKLFIPQDGTYTLDVTRWCVVQLDGKQLERGDVELKKGIYEVHLAANTHGGDNLQPASVRFVATKTKVVIPLVNSSADIKSFLQTKVEGQEVKEVSGWKPSRSNRVKVESKPRP